MKHIDFEIENFKWITLCIISLVQEHGKKFLWPGEDFLAKILRVADFMLLKEKGDQIL